MNRLLTPGLTMLAGIAIGALVVQGLHAQAKPPVYYIAEIDVTDPAGYAKEYVPKVQAMIKADGGRLLAAAGAGSSGAKVTAFDGAAPKRVAINVWDSLEKIQAWQNSAEYKELAKTRAKYAKIRSFAVEGLPQ
jgi:uncharacterized protein (DUF1330 family)